MRDEHRQGEQQGDWEQTALQEAAASKEREADRGVPRADHNLDENDGTTPAQGETSRGETFGYGSDR